MIVDFCRISQLFSRNKVVICYHLSLLWRQWRLVVDLGLVKAPRAEEVRHV